MVARKFVAVVVTSAAALVFAPAALASSAGTTNSTNWAGYAVHGNDVTYHSVSGSWREPSASCTPGAGTYSSYWVGLGGYSLTSPALEQIGTEVDCSPSGQIRSSAWYELVPAAAVQLRLTVNPGDQMTASVTANGKRVTVSLYDATRKQGFSKTLTASPIDVTSAEWIVEAPSECVGQNTCQTLPLANFGTATFTNATAISSSGHTGRIDDPAWQTTEITLVPDAHRVFIGNAPNATVGSATPSAVANDNHSFKVTYSATSIATGPPTFSRIDARLRPATAMRPGR